MSKQSLERECTTENNQNRGVDHVRNRNMDDFWRRSSGNFFISGDAGTYAGNMENIRRRMLLSAVRNAPAFAYGSLIIFHNSSILENELIGMAGTLGRELVVTSERYQNYHPFYGMKQEKILTYFDTVGRMCGYYNMSAADAYTKAFMAIVRAVYPVSLQAMQALAEKSDQEIHTIAQAYGVRQDILQDFDRASINGGRDTFCLILNRISSALSGITKEDCQTKFNIVTATESRQPPRVILLNLNSSEPAILNLYLKNELDIIRGRRVSVIVDDIPMYEEDRLIVTLRDFVKNQNNTVGLCAGDIFNMVKEEDLKGFNTHCIFRHADTSSLETLLGNYGTYRYAYVQEANVIPAGRLFTLIPQRTYTKAYYEMRPRIMLQEMSQAVLKGHNAERVEIVDNLR